MCECVENLLYIVHIEGRHGHHWACDDSTRQEHGGGNGTG